MSGGRAFRVPPLVSLTLTAALAVTGCATTPDASPAGSAPLPASAAGPSPAASPATSGTATAVAAAVPESLKFTGTTLAGEKFDAARMAGKPAVLWFWAPWCATCASEAQSIGDLQQKYGEKLQILGIAGLGGTADMKDFVSDFQLSAVPHLNDPDGKLWKKFEIPQQSWYVLLDRTGKIVHRGYLDDLQLTEKVQALTA